MRNIICIALTLALALSLTACGSTAAETSPSTETTTATVAATDATSAYPTEPDGSIKQGRVPNVIGRDSEFAQLDMKASGFTNITIEEVDSEMPAGTVVDQNVEAYVTLTVDTAVVLYVSNGNAPAATEAANG